MRSSVPVLAAAALIAALPGCGRADSSASASPPVQVTTTVGQTTSGFQSHECNGITDTDITTATGTSLFARVLVNDVGCFWQENTVVGSFGAGMGISTWWYRGSDIDVERDLEKKAGRTLTDISLDGNAGFKAYDQNACSIYVTKGRDLITWSIQTMNPATLPDLCAITGELAELSQDRVN